MNRAVIYTAIMGSKDDLIEVPSINGCDFVCFTDNPELKSDTWEIKQVTPISQNNTLNAKPFKIVPHLFFPDYQYSIWIDGNFGVNPGLDINYMIGKYLSKSHIANFRHHNATKEFDGSIHRRDCLYREAEVCIQYRLDTPSRIVAQVERYRQERCPENNGLYNCGIIFRRHNNIRNAMNAWWVEVTLGSIRDQISFPYILWKHNLAITQFCGTLCKSNPYFIPYPHKKEGENNNNQKYSSWLGDIGHFLREENIDIFGLYKHQDIPFLQWFQERKTQQEVIDILRKWNA